MDVRKTLRPPHRLRRKRCTSLLLTFCAPSFSPSQCRDLSLSLDNNDCATTILPYPTETVQLFSVLFIFLAREEGRKDGLMLGKGVRDKGVRGIDRWKQGNRGRRGAEKTENLETVMGMGWNGVECAALLGQPRLSDVNLELLERRRTLL
eukprot:452103-Rhodomonas_salina.1